MTYDREKLMGFLRDFMRLGGVRVVDDIPADAKIVVTRVSDFDPQSNSVWLIDKNKSYDRGLKCGACGEPVVISDGAYERWLKNKDPKQIICGKCSLGI